MTWHCVAVFAYFYPIIEDNMLNDILFNIYLVNIIYSVIGILVNGTFVSIVRFRYIAYYTKCILIFNTRERCWLLIDLLKYTIGLKEQLNRSIIR